MTSLELKLTNAPNSLKELSLENILTEIILLKMTLKYRIKELEKN